MVHTKYPRTCHVPWSPGATSDDMRTSDLSHFQDERVIVTEKMDGENTSIYQDRIHARSLDSAYHPSRTWVKALQGQIGYSIPEGWRVCGENLYATHSIHYESLPSYFLFFSIWDSQTCLDWDQTLEWGNLLNLTPVPVLYDGTFRGKILRELQVPLDRSEGWVIRLARSFALKDFSRSVAKWVRPRHVTTDQHWMSKPVIPNKLS